MTALDGGVLDDLVALRRIDASGMLGAIAAIPGQVSDAWARSRELDLPDRHRATRSVAVLGMGGSAIGGDLVRAIWSDRLRVPIEVVRGYELPAWVGGDTLVVASSHSGATEETLSAVEAAFVRGCPVAVITTGGPLGRVAQQAGLPTLAFPGGGQPRAAVGYSVTLLAGLLERAGALPLDGAEVAAGAAAASEALARFGPVVPTDANRAKQLAWSLVGRLPVIEASGPLAAVARRWKTQLNENGKTTAAWEELPEANHNTVVGYAQPDTLHDHQVVVFLSGPDDHPRNRLRSDLSVALLADAGIASETVVIDVPGRFGQALTGIVLGDLVSTYLAALYGTDPTPVASIARLKAALAAAEAPVPEPPEQDRRAT